MLKIPERYYDNSDGLWNFMPEIHRPGGKRFLHDDWPIFKYIPRTYTSFLFLKAVLLKGDPEYYVHSQTGAIFKGRYPNEPYWTPKPWGLRGTYQKTSIHYQDPVTKKEFTDIYKSRVYKNGFAWRKGVRLSDDDINGKPAWYVNYVPIPYVGNLLTFGTKSISK